MRSVQALWREERPSRWFFAAHLQGGLGAAAGYVALMLLAYERIGSAWAATAVMLADLIPSMLLGPLLGSLVDRTGRLRCAVVSDIVRASAFAALVLHRWHRADDRARAHVRASATPSSAPRPPRSCPRSWTARASRPPTRSTAWSATSASWSARPAPPACSCSARPSSCSASTPSPSRSPPGCSLRLRGHVRAVARRAGRRAGGALHARRHRDRRARPRRPHADGLLRRGRPRRRLDQRRRARARPAGPRRRPAPATRCSSAPTASVSSAARCPAPGATAVTRPSAAATSPGSRSWAVGMLATPALAPSLGIAVLTFAFTGAANGLFSVSNRTLLQRIDPGAPPRARLRRRRLDRLLGLRRRRHRRRSTRHHPRRPRDVRDRRRRRAGRLGAAATPPRAPPRSRPVNRSHTGRSSQHKGVWPLYAKGARPL